MSGAVWLVRRLGWLAVVFGALVLTLWVCAPRVPPPAQIQRVHYFPRGTA